MQLMKRLRWEWSYLWQCETSGWKLYPHRVLCTLCTLHRIKIRRRDASDFIFCGLSDTFHNFHHRHQNIYRVPFALYWHLKRIDFFPRFSHHFESSLLPHYFEMRKPFILIADRRDEFWFWIEGSISIGLALLFLFDTLLKVRNFKN